MNHEESQQNVQEDTTSTETLSTAEHTESHGGKISGYRKLNPEEIDRINELKQLGNIIHQQLLRTDRAGTCDPRWLAMARTELQKGIMFAIRSVAKPEGF